MFGVIHFCVCLCVFVSSTYADRDDRKWVWDDNKRGSARFIDSHSEAAERYNVYEADQNGGPLYTEVLPRPQPIIPERPGNVYLDNNQGAYGLGAGSYHVTNGVAQGVLTGPVQNQVPLQDLDRCKCTQKFNCQGIAYGHCDVGKQYCCYSSSQVKPQGVFRPAVPGNSIDSNGVLVGPGATRPGYGLENGVLTAPKPGYGLENGILTAPARPVVRPHRPSIVGGHNRRPFNGNTYSSANGVLVGPGGPIDRPGYGFARSN
ncbi:unnamed protein product [Callosobruchus maculatus]|uniref:Uncharacterized protein n=1 Tax=Callosobruchus maculatus TaxID=64391 RepID=A0A653CGI0_CALMS|nr:unnamed protein product [Callosobruchus maculatus]